MTSEERAFTPVVVIPPAPWAFDACTGMQVGEIGADTTMSVGRAYEARGWLATFRPGEPSPVDASVILLNDGTPVRVLAVAPVHGGWDVTVVGLYGAQPVPITAPSEEFTPAPPGERGWLANMYRPVWYAPGVPFTRRVDNRLYLVAAPPCDTCHADAGQMCDPHGICAAGVPVSVSRGLVAAATVSVVAADGSGGPACMGCDGCRARFDVRNGAVDADGVGVDDVPGYACEECLPEAVACKAGRFDID